RRFPRPARSPASGAAWPRPAVGWSSLGGPARAVESMAAPLGRRRLGDGGRGDRGGERAAGGPDPPRALPERPATARGAVLPLPPGRPLAEHEGQEVTLVLEGELVAHDRGELLTEQL